MTFDLGTTAPNVVTEGRLRSLMAEGFNAEVICTSSATRKAAVWYGKWVIRGVSQDGSSERLLVLSRASADKDEVQIREFKTANGLISFLSDLGCSHANIPLKEGGRSTHTLHEGDAD
ncbi:MAG: hypothetical protein AAFO78_02900 [Pseudomonadota bacterium]